MNPLNLFRSPGLFPYLLTHPLQLPRYVTKCLSPAHTPMQLELPWLAYPVIDILNKRKINAGTDVLELGGGGSTLYFAKRGAKVTCFETSSEWAEKITEKCRLMRLDNVVVKVFEFDSAVEDAPEKDRMKEEMQKNQYDIILVDNADMRALHRPGLFYLAETIVKDGGLIILDDSFRYPEIRVKNNAKRWRTFKAIGPARQELTETDIYFY